MYLNKLLLKDFGKFHNKEVTLKPGLNLIYGENEAGKTTVKEFIVGMLYGIDKSRGLAARLDTYELHKPIYENGYSGKAYINFQGKSHLIERSFLRYNRTVSVLDVQAGREVSLRNANTLHGTMFDLDKNTYVNTLCIGEHGAAPGKELANELDNYLANLTTTGSADIDKQKAIDSLKERRREFDTKLIQKMLDKIDDELTAYATVDEELAEIRRLIRENDEELAIETERRKREARKLVEDANKDESEDEDTAEEEELTYEDIRKQYEAEKQAEEEAKAKGEDPDAKKAPKVDSDLIDDEDDPFPKKKLTDQLWFIFLTGIFVIGVIALMVNILPFEKGVRQLFVICTALFVVVTIVEGLYAKSEIEENGGTPTDDEFLRMIYKMERKAEVKSADEIDMSFAKAFTDRKIDLQADQKVILDKIAKRDELREEYAAYKNKLDNSERELHAINLAINTINEVSKEIHDDLGFIINNNISDIVSRITNGKYTDVYLDENLHVLVRENDGYVGIEYLSAGTIEQIYLAVRLSVARFLCRDKMPLIIDDIFTNYDERRLMNTLDCLKTIDTEQIVLLTSNPHIGDMLDDLDMDYNYVEL